MTQVQVPTLLLRSPSPRPRRRSSPSQPSSSKRQRRTSPRQKSLSRKPPNLRSNRLVTMKPKLTSSCRWDSLVISANLPLEPHLTTSSEQSSISSTEFQLMCVPLQLSSKAKPHLPQAKEARKEVLNSYALYSEHPNSQMFSISYVKTQVHSNPFLPSCPNPHQLSTMYPIINSVDRPKPSGIREDLSRRGRRRTIRLQSQPPTWNHHDLAGRRASHQQTAPTRLQQGRGCPGLFRL